VVRLLAIVTAIALSGCSGSTQVRSAAGPGAAGPGAGFLTQGAPQARSLRDGFRVTPILTAGDTLYSNDPQGLPFIFAGRAGGLGARDLRNGTAEVCVSHYDGWLEGQEGAMVSRLVLDLRNAGVYTADYLLRPGGYEAFAHASLLDSRAGFSRPQFVVNERTYTRHWPLVAAIDLLGERVQNLPWLGAVRHKSTIALPSTGGKAILVMAGGSLNQNGDQLYLYIANSDTDLLAGSGQLYVFRADPTVVPKESRFASRLRKGDPVAGSFIPIEASRAQSPQYLEPLVQSLGSLNFVRLECLAVDRERINAFYFTDRFGFGSTSTLQISSGGGRLYHMTLDAFDPTRVEAIEVVLDATEGDDLFRPTSIDTDEHCVMIQEFPSSRGVHPSRILRYDVRARRVEAVAECAERDTRGRPAPTGVGGEWESSGITNVSDLFGEDAWLFTVQAHTLQSPQNSSRYGEAGQLLLLRGPRNPQTSAPRQ
jgi:hypothetical protein